LDYYKICNTEGFDKIELMDIKFLKEEYLQLPEKEKEKIQEMTLLLIKHPHLFTMFLSGMITVIIEKLGLDKEKILH
jgi:hypothetical protein